MQSFNDLNNFANTSVSYNSQSDYDITPGTPLGDTTVTAVEGSVFTVPAQQPITTMTNLTRDLLIIITPTPMNGVGYVQYTGADAGISVVSDQVSRWIVSGVRTVAQYNDVFTNLKMGVAPGFSSVGTYTFLVSLDDQVNGTIASYTVTVTVTVSTVFTVPAFINFNEDQNARVANIAIVENFLYATNYTVVLTTENPATGRLAFAPANVAANTLTLTNVSKASANLSLANVVFVPAADFAGNTFIDTTVTRIYNSQATGKRTLAYIAGTNPEYSAPAAYAWSENSTTPIGTTPNGNLRITDAAVGKNYSSTVSIVSASMGNLQVGNTVLGNTVTYSGNMVTVNNSLANVTFVGNPSNKVSGNVGYVQLQTTDSVTQANITIPLNYQIPAIHLFSNVAKPFGTRLNSDGSYTGGNATANVDFWAYTYNTQTVVSGGKAYQFYTTPSTANVVLSTMRRNDVYKYAPLSVGIIPATGIRSRQYGAGAPGFFSFWMRATQYHAYAAFVQLDTWLYLTSYAGNLYWNLTDTTRVSSGFAPMIELGATPYGNEWTHLAIQITAGTPANLPTTAGTKLVSAWRDGVPITAFYGGYSAGNVNQGRGPLQTGLTWWGKGSWGSITNFVMGAPLRYGTSSVTGFNNSIGVPFVDIQVDDIQIRQDTPYTDLQSFTPQPVVWGGNVTQMVTGI